MQVRWVCSPIDKAVKEWNNFYLSQKTNNLGNIFIFYLYKETIQLFRSCDQFRIDLKKRTSKNSTQYPFPHGLNPSVLNAGGNWIQAQPDLVTELYVTKRQILCHPCFPVSCWHLVRHSYYYFLHSTLPSSRMGNLPNSLNITNALPGSGEFKCWSMFHVKPIQQPYLFQDIAFYHIVGVWILNSFLGNMETLTC